MPVRMSTSPVVNALTIGVLVGEVLERDPLIAGASPQ